MLNEKILDFRKIVDSTYTCNSVEITENSCYVDFSVIDQPSIKREHILLLSVSQGSHCIWKPLGNTPGKLLEIQFLKQDKRKKKIKNIVTQIMKQVHNTSNQK